MAGSPEKLSRFYCAKVDGEKNVPQKNGGMRDETSSFVILEYLYSFFLHISSGVSLSSSIY